NNTTKTLRFAGTLDYSCGGKDPPSPPFTAPNFTSPGCNFVYCGDGVCALNASGTGHICQCHERAANLFNDPQNLCIQQCYLDGDCGHLKLLPPPPPSKAAPGAGKSFTCCGLLAHSCLVRWYHNEIQNREYDSK
ncbi:hypothetical protein Tco_0124940, partial [Tanacetum coccineum]